jgi:hypothetical protein
MPEDQRPFAPFLAVMDGNVFLGGSTQLFEQLIAAEQGTADRLADSPSYQALAAQVQRETPGVVPAVWMYSRVEETLRQWYDVLTSDKTRDKITELSANNAFFAALADAMAAHELPAFDVLAKYAAPSAGVIYDTDTGYHGFSFTLRRETSP